VPMVNTFGPADPPPDAAEVMIPMRDGVRLAADLYLAGTGEPAPVVLVRLPYDKDGTYCFMPEIGRYLRARGYHFVAQDVRGKYRSEGRTEFGLHEPADGYDTIQWISEQAWCDGDIVMWGDSYYGYTAIAAAISAHPALRAIAPRVTGSQLSMTLEYPDGTRDVEQTARKMYFASHYLDADRYEWEPDWSTRPLRDAFEEFFAEIGKRSPCFDAEFEGGSPFVPQPLKALLESPPVPALYTIGWFDNCAIWSWHDVRALTRDPGWAEAVYLRLEAIDHENYRLADAPVGPGDDHALTPAALDRMLPRYLDPAIEFFDAVLGRSNALAALPRVRYEVCHGDSRTGDAWPPPQTPALEFHLTAEPTPALTTAPHAERTLRWTHDPHDLVPSASPNPFAALHDRPDMSALAERADVLAFPGTVAAEDLDLIGPVTLQLCVTAPAASHVHALLLDVEPDGRAYVITKGQVQVSQSLHAAPLVIDLQDIAYRLRTGHRLALYVMSSDFPDYVPEAPAGRDPWTSMPGEPSSREITLGGDPPSRLLIGGAPNPTT
jgi:putative CocE/NonD family hydrolase